MVVGGLLFRQQRVTSINVATLVGAPLVVWLAVTCAYPRVSREPAKRANGLAATSYGRKTSSGVRLRAANRAWPLA
jgi:hypothetical protein